MAAPTTTNSFLEMLRRSNLLPEGKLDEYLKALPDADGMSPAELAGRLVQDSVLTHFQANHLLKGRYKNFFIGKFKVLEPLGSGGMSQVFLCEHAMMRHRVALKMLPIKESTDPASVNRFLREARAAAAVNHPNVVRAHDFDQSDGKFYYLIMDYVDGVNLHDLVKGQGPLPAAQAANYIAQTAAGLQHIYENGLIHRDLKPSNLLLDRGGVIRILDLGLARFTDDANDNITRQFQNNTIMGTADYLAPEQALMMDNIDIRADIYSLGATFYYLLSGKAPFESSTVTQKLLAHQMREPEELPGVPADIRAVVKTMMAKKAEDRYQTPADVIDALAGWLNEPLSPPDESLFPHRSGASGPNSGGPRTSPPPSTAAGPKTSPVSRVGLGSGTPAPRGRGNSGSLSDILSARSGNMPRPADPTPAPGSVKRRPKWVVPAAAAGGLLLAAAVVVAVVNPFKSPPAAAPPAGPNSPNTVVAAKKTGPAVPPAPVGPPPPAGSIVVSADGPVRTVAAALITAKAGARIFITDEVHSEPPLIVDSPEPNIRVSGWPESRPVIWKPAADSLPTVPLVRVANAPGFTLANAAFDGDGRSNTLLTFAGQCPGAGLDGVTVSGYRAAGVAVTGGQGDAGREIRFRRLRTAGGTCGVRLASAAEGYPTRHVLIEKSRFDGPARAGVDVVGAVEAATVSYSRFAGTSDGVRLPGPAAATVSLTLNNCVFTGGAGAALAANVLPDPASTITVTNSLFYKNGRIFRFAAFDPTPAGPPPVWVWHDEELPPEKGTNIPAGTRYFRKTVTLPAVPADAVLDVGCVNNFKVWVNGTPAGESLTPYFTKRVYAFPVGKLLKAGENVIAVEGTNTTDPVNPGFAVAAGLTVRLAEKGTSNVFAATDATWVSSALGLDGWQKPGFAAEGWKPVKPWDKPGYNFPWNGAVWDSAVPPAFAADKLPKFVLGGNVRDYHTPEGFPLSESVRGIVDKLAGMDPADDATYLRTPRAAGRLNTMGTTGGPVGVPQE